MTEKPLRYLNHVTALFVAVLLISNVASSKMTSFGPFTFDAGTLLFPLSYIFGDILTEVYGYRRSRQVIWLGFAAALLMSLTFIVVGKLPPADGWTGQEAYMIILGLTPRIVAASLLAYFCGEFLNSFVLAKMKLAMAGRHLWVRTIGSTFVGQLVDTAIFVLVAFWGVLPKELLWVTLVSNYVFKVGVEVALTPLTYRTVAWLKRAENEDYYDRFTNFNPFAVKDRLAGK